MPQSARTEDIWTEADFRVVQRLPSLEQLSQGETHSVGWLDGHIHEKELSSRTVGCPRPQRFADWSERVELRRTRAGEKVAHFAKSFASFEGLIDQGEDSADPSDSPAVLPHVLPGARSEPVFSLQTRLTPTPVAAPQSAGCCSGLLAALRSCAGVGKLRGRRPQLPFDAKDSAVIILDWDDTLFPTHFIVANVMPQMEKAGKRDSPLGSGMMFYDQLADHAKIVRFVLTQASRVARVAIVTLSMSPWVEASSDLYLPGLKIGQLLKELEIKVYYSRDHVAQEAQVTTWDVTLDRSKVSGAQVGMDVDLLEGGSLLVRNIAETGAAAHWNKEHPEQALKKHDQITSVNGEVKNIVKVCRAEQVLHMKVERKDWEDAYVKAKEKDMRTCLESLYRGNVPWHRNVISIGDSDKEKKAIKELLAPDASAPRDTMSKPLCKTVQLLTAPPLEQLGNQLRILMVWLPRLVAHTKSFDMTMDELDEIEKELFEKGDNMNRRASAPSS